MLKGLSLNKSQRYSEINSWIQSEDGNDILPFTMSWAIMDMGMGVPNSGMPY